MKRLYVVLIIVAVLVLSTCIDPLWDFPEIPSLGLQTTQDVMQWVADYVTFQSDSIHYPADDYWQSPAQTYVWGHGDCEDFAILALYLECRDVGIKGRLIIGTVWGGGHAWLWADGHFWEPQWGWTIDGDPNYSIMYSISYDEAIERATTTHKSLVGELE